MVAAPQRRATLEDLANTPDDGRRYELINGEIVVLAGPAWMHQEVVVELLSLLRDWTRPRGLGRVVPSPIDIVLNGENSVQPDVVFVSTGRLDRIRDGRFHGPPDLAVEVVSPTNPSHDSVTKLFRYAASGIPEYWLVDPVARSFLVLRLEDGMYVPQEPDTDGRLASVVLPGLTVDPAALFEAALGTAS